MIAGWLLYCLVESALVAAAAVAIEALLTRNRRPARWVWAATIAVTLLIPAAALVLQQRTPAPLPRAEDASNESFFMRATAAADRRASSRSFAALRMTTPAARPRMPEIAGGDRIVVALAIACILIAGVRIAADSWLLYRGRRRWTRGVVDGVPVWFSDDVGPAIVGLIEPLIVLPRWTETLSPDERALMLAHEQEHLRAHDGRLTTAAIFATMAMPWNPVACWTLRRLRTAIEVDCDRRVLSVFPDISRYGRLLVDVAQRAVGSSLAIAGFSERAAPLARRIQAMTARVRPARAMGVVTTGASACALAAAVAILPPAAPARTTRTPASVLQTLPKNVGDSIAEGESRPKVIAAASGLPAAFTTVEYGPAELERPLAGRCAERLRDDRDDARLQVMMSTTSTSTVVQRADTAWTRIESVGYYAVRPAGRYGVSAGQTLRVGCGGYTRVSVGGRDVELVPPVTDESRDDDRARQISQRMAGGLHLTPTLIELRRGRLNVAFADLTTLRAGDAADVFASNTFGILRDVFNAPDAVPETLAVSIRVGPSAWTTHFYYRSMQK
ncbi:MAG: M56 family metallopeptidase [Gemmatimonadaceae bacterium]